MYIKRSDAIRAIWGDDINPSGDGMVFEAQSHIDRDIRLIPPADRKKTMGDELIRRSDAIGACSYETIECYEARKAIRALPPADRPQGYWTKTDVATYRCSECGKIQIADDESELNFCCCCGSRNKVRRKGADDE